MYAHICVYSETYIYMHIYMCIFDCRLEIAKSAPFHCHLGIRFPTIFHKTDLQHPCFEGKLKSQENPVNNLTTVGFCMHFQSVITFSSKTVPVKRIGFNSESRRSLLVE